MWLLGLKFRVCMTFSKNITNIYILTEKKAAYPFFKVCIYVYMSEGRVKN